WSRSSWSEHALYFLFNAGLIGCFLGHYFLVGLNQLAGGNGHVDRFMDDYWSDAYPPANPLDFGKWFLLIHSGRMLGYPVGDANGGSALSTLVFLVGLVKLVRWQSPRELVLLLLTPFVLNFVAAVLHKYPYGGCCRISQHLAPATCMLIGLGLAALVE